jgi:hypothetical protein
MLDAKTLRPDGAKGTPLVFVSPSGMGDMRRRRFVVRDRIVGEGLLLLLLLQVRHIVQDAV